MPREVSEMSTVVAVVGENDGRLILSGEDFDGDLDWYPDLKGE